MLKDTLRVIYLDNGLKVIVVENRKNPILTSHIWVKVGVLDEEDGCREISHLLEHLLFQNQEDVDLINAVGGEYNGLTGLDYTYYYNIVPAEHQETSLKVLRSIVLGPKFLPEQVEKERQIVTEEMYQYKDMPQRIIADALLSLSYTQSRFSRGLFATDVPTIRQQDVVNHYKRFYRPENALVIVAGDVDYKNTIALVDRYFGDWPKGHFLPSSRPSEPEQQDLRYNSDQVDIHFNMIGLLFKLAKPTPLELLRFKILENIFCNSRSSRAQKNIVEAQKAQMVAGSLFETKENMVPFYLTAIQEAEKDPRECISAIIQEIEKIKKYPISQQELEKAVNILKRQWIQKYERIEGVAEMIGMAEVFDNYDIHDNYLRYLDETTPRDINDLVHKFLKTSRLNIMGLYPKKPVFTVPELPQIQGDIRREQKGLIADIKEHTMQNGMRTYLKEMHHLPIVYVNILIGGGAKYDTTAKAGLANMAMTLCQRETRERTNLAITNAIDYLGLSLGGVTTRDYARFQASCLPKNLEKSLALLADILLYPTFPTDFLEIERNQAITAFKTLRNDMFRNGLRLFLKTLYQNSGYGTYSIGDLDSLAALDRDSIIGWHKRFIHPQNMLVTMVGDINSQEVIDMLETYLGEKRNGAPSRDDTFQQSLCAPGAKHVEYLDQLNQTGLVMGQTGPKLSDPQALAFSLAIDTLGKTMDCRLFKHLRLEKKLCYHTLAAYDDMLHSGYYLVYVATTQPDTAQEALLHVLREFKQHPPTEEEIQKKKNLMIGQFKIANESLGFQCHSLATDKYLHNDWHYSKRRIERVASITRAEVLDTIERYIDLDKLVSIRITQKP